MQRIPQPITRVVCIGCPTWTLLVAHDSLAGIVIATMQSQMVITAQLVHKVVSIAMIVLRIVARLPFDIVVGLACPSSKSAKTSDILRSHLVLHGHVFEAGRFLTPVHLRRDW